MHEREIEGAAGQRTKQSPIRKQRRAFRQFSIMIGQRL